MKDRGVCKMKFDLSKLHYNVECTQYNDKAGQVAGWVFYEGEKLTLRIHSSADNCFIRRQERMDVVQYFQNIQVEELCGFQVSFVREEDMPYFIDAYINGQFLQSIEIRKKALSFGKALQIYMQKYVNGQGLGKAIGLFRKNNLNELKYKFDKEMFFIRNSQVKGTYDNWYRNNHACSTYELEKQAKIKFDFQPLISIVVPVFNVKDIYLKTMIKSVQEQTYTHWELCLVEASTSPDSYEIIKKYMKNDSRIKVCKVENKGISENTNIALSMTTGDYIGFLDDDDLLVPEALFMVAQCINNNKPDMIYSDEDKIDERDFFVSSPHFKPDFAPYTLRSFNYITHFLVVKKELREKVGLFRKKYDGAQDYDFVLRCSEQTSKIEHIPHVLYHWRIHENSTSATSEAKPYTDIAGKNVIHDHLQRLGLDGTVEGALERANNMYHVKYVLHDKPLVSIIIPNYNNKAILERCINSILANTQYENYEIIVVENNSTDADLFTYYKELENNKRVHVISWNHPFNYSALNNFAVEFSHGEYLVLLNNDTKILTSDWMEELLGVCQQQDVGAVGVKLVYEDGTIQHGGVILGIGDVADHAHKGYSMKSSGYMGRLVVAQNFSAVTAALMMTRKSLYKQVGGLDERYTVAYNDVDFCMKITSLGKYIIFDPFVCAYHYESKTRGLEDTPKKKARYNKEVKLFHDKWGKVDSDPFYNINFARDRASFSLRIDLK